jgi:hypothetical protein
MSVDAKGMSEHYSTQSFDGNAFERIEVVSDDELVDGEQKARVSVLVHPISRGELFFCCSSSSRAVT